MTDTLLNVPTYCLLPSRAPARRPFEHLLDSAETEIACYLAGLTDDRLRDNLGDISLVPAGERLAGEGSSVLMGAFTQQGVSSRFSSGRYGVYYASLDLATAIEESKHSMGRFLANTHEEACEITMQCFSCEIAGSFLDLRGASYDRLHSPDDWQAAQNFAAQGRACGARGLLYRSINNPGGECVAAFRPSTLRPPAKAGFWYRFVWDGKQFSGVFQQAAWGCSL